MTSITELCHRFMPAMTTSGYDRVINVASVSGRIASVCDSHYGAAKAYVIALSLALTLIVKAQGVDASALCPGLRIRIFMSLPG